MSYVNFGVALLNAGITASASSLTVRSGQGVRFGVGSWYGVIWDTYYSNASEAYWEGRAEIVLATSDGSDTILITRAQQGTVARAFNRAGRTYQIILSATASDFGATSAHLEFKYGSCIEGSNSISWDSDFLDTNYTYTIEIQAADGSWSKARNVVLAVDGLTFESDTAGTYRIFAGAK